MMNKRGPKPKSKRQECLRIQFKNRIFYDFLRGCFDGGGSFYSYWDKSWRSSHMFYLSFVSASEKHIKWLRAEIKDKE